MVCQVSFLEAAHPTAKANTFRLYYGGSDAVVGTAVVSFERTPGVSETVTKGGCLSHRTCTAKDGVFTAFHGMFRCLSLPDSAHRSEQTACEA